MKKKSGITAILNKYKNTFNDLIDSSDTKSPNWPTLIRKGSRNAPRSKGNIMGFSEEDCFDKDVLDTLLELILKTQNSQIHQCHNIATFDPKSRKTQYEKGRKGEKDGKSKRGREDRESERSGEGY